MQAKQQLFGCETGRDPFANAACAQKIDNEVIAKPEKVELKALSATTEGVECTSATEVTVCAAGVTIHPLTIGTVFTVVPNLLVVGRCLRDVVSSVE